MILVTLKRAILVGAVALCSSMTLVNAHEKAPMDHGKMDHSKMKHSSKSSIKVHMAWSRSLPPVATNGAVYLMIHNYSAQAETLISASSPMAKQVMFHRNQSHNGSIVMAHQDNVVIKAGGAVMFKPGAQHIMLMGLTKPLVAGGSFPMTLNFEHEKSVTVTVKVKALQ